MLVFFTINVTPSLALFNLSQLFYLNFFDWFGRFNFFYRLCLCSFDCFDLDFFSGRFGDIGWGGIWQPVVISRLSLYIQMTSSSFVSFSPYIKSAWRIFIFCFYFSFVNLTFYVASFFLPFVNNDFNLLIYVLYLLFNFLHRVLIYGKENKIRYA